MAIHNIEITLGKGGQLARAAGAVAKLIAKEGKLATLKLPYGQNPFYLALTWNHVHLTHLLLRST
ncbi:hypothetical protein R6Q59_031425 [Mikania micrantha]